VRRLGDGDALDACEAGLESVEHEREDPRAYVATNEERRSRDLSCIVAGEALGGVRRGPFEAPPLPLEGRGAAARLSV
jgi:hypothetical protein